MPLAKITGPGLAAIAGSVALLWSCVILQHIAQRDAWIERARVIREVRNLRQLRQPHTVPVSDPSPLVPRRLHVTAG
jgi:hypothetical protein